jgi:hypothetical protein
MSDHDFASNVNSATAHVDIASMMAGATRLRDSAARSDGYEEQEGVVSVRKITPANQNKTTA